MFYYKLVNIITLFLFFISTLSANDLNYVRNDGQWHENVVYKTNMKDGGVLFLEQGAFTFLYSNSEVISQEHQNHCKQDCSKSKSPLDHEALLFHAFKLEFMNSNPDQLISGLNKKKEYNNYFLGNDKSKWKGEVPIFGQTIYSNLYDNIDLLVYGNNGILKYDYILKPAAKLSDIQVKYTGLEDMFLSSKGDLVLQTSINSIIESAPYAYQIINNDTIEVDINYVLSNNKLTFNAPFGYDKKHSLIIDPSLIASTYTGSQSDNWGFTATYDKNGNMYAGGIAFATGYPISVGAYDGSYNGVGFDVSDVALTKFSADGKNLIWSTYIGGSESDYPHSIIVDENDQIVVYGSTFSTNFPKTIGPNHQGDSDIFMVKLNSNATGLINARLYGGTNTDGQNNSNLAYNYGDFARGDLEIAPNGDIIIASVSNSTDLPNISNQIQNQNNGFTDGIIVRFSSNLANVIWASYFGGTRDDALYDIEIESSGSILLTGGTESLDLQGMTGLNINYQGGVADGFILRINGNGTSILNGTYIGTNEYDQCYFVETDPDDNVYVLGQSLGDYSVSQGVWSSNRAPQFIHKLNHNLSTTIYSTVFGTPNNAAIGFVDISPTAFLVDVCENVYAMGFGDIGGMGSFGDVTPPFQNNLSSGFYLFVLDRDGNDALFGGGIGDPLGGDHVDGGTSRFDRNGYVYQAVCASCGGSSGFPTTPNAYSSNNNSDNCNLAIFKVEFELAALRANIGYDLLNECVPAMVNFENLSNKDFGPGQTLIWDFGDGNSVTNVENPSHTYLQEGTYEVTLIVIDSSVCNIIDTAKVELTFLASTITVYDSTAICNGQTFTLPDGTIVDQAGNYSNNNNCDTNYIIVLEVLESFDTIFQTYSCSPIDTFTNVQIYSGVNGCDSVVVTKVSLVFRDSIIINLATCDAQDSGLVIQNFINQFGCDSFITTYTQLYPSYDTVIYQNTCFPSDSGVFVNTLQSYFGCDSIITQYISLTDFELISYSVDSSNCNDDFGGVHVTFSGGIPPYSYSISNGNNATVQTTQIDIPLPSGIYQIIVTDSVECSFTVDFEIFRDESGQIEVFPEYSEVFLGESVTFNGAPIDGAFLWTPPTYLDCDTCLNATSLPGNSITYLIQRKDALGCITFDSVFIEVTKPEVFVPSAFTPNNDGLNDILYIIKDYLEDIDVFSIYSRWGEVVFETNDINEGWDGKYKNEMQEMDVYVYYLRASLIISNEVIENKGFIFLIH